MSGFDAYRNYLYDLGPIIMERALEAKAKIKALKPGPDRNFQEGRLLAFNEVISIMQQQANGLAIPLSELRLNGIEPDRDLI